LAERAIFFLIKSDDSHIGPTIFQLLALVSWLLLIFHTSCSAPYREGLRRSFIAESTIKKLSLIYSTEVSNVPAIEKKILY
jgi:hypothetical protein